MENYILERIGQLRGLVSQLAHDAEVHSTGASRAKHAGAIGVVLGQIEEFALQGAQPAPPPPVEIDVKLSGHAEDLLVDAPPALAEGSKRPKK